MAGTTTNFTWPFPTNADVPNVASDIQSVAAAIDGTLGNAWTTYTPVWGASGVAPVVGNGTITGRWKQFGKWGLFTVTLNLGPTSTVGTGTYSWTMPPGWTQLSTGPILGIGSMYDASTGFAYPGAMWSNSTTTFNLRPSGVTLASATVPVVPATTDIFNFLGLTELV